MEHFYNVSELLLLLSNRMKAFTKSLLLSGAVSLGLMNAAVAAVDIPGSQDLGVFDRYTLSTIVEYETTSVPEYALAVGKLKKVNGVTSPEEQRYLSGQLTKVTYQIPSGHNTKEVAAFVQSMLDKRQAEVFFQCTARNCGSSNDWANRVFGVQKLNGLTGKQYYWAAALQGDNGASNTLAIYLTQRGNRQVYLHIEAVQNQSSEGALTADGMLERWQTGGRVFLLSASLTEESVEELAQAMQEIFDQRPFSKVWLVGHQGGTLPFLVLLKNSEQTAVDLRQQLIDLGLPENRIYAQGVGPLAPASASVPKNRIEILVE